ncbi:MAG: Fic family protein [Campylobacterota bacterium]|nr:Fic family protein [Campylobacterota bacterium]
MINPNEINNLSTVTQHFKQDQKYFIMMAKKDKIDFVYNTSALEGNAMTYPEVQTLLEGITVGGHKLTDEQQILNQNRSVELLFTMLEASTFDLNKETLCKLHVKVAQEEALSWGVFRDGNVNIGGTDYLPPKFQDLDALFKNGIKALKLIHDPILKALSYFLFGARTQFFFDGNKRVSRLIMNGILLHAGLPILNIKAKDRLEFNSKMISFYDTENYVEILTYLVHYYEVQNRHLKMSA